MASMSISLRKMANSILFSKLHNPTIRSFSSIPSVFHSFNTKSVLINNNYYYKKVQSRPISRFPDGCSEGMDNPNWEVPMKKKLLKVSLRGGVVEEGWKNSGTGSGYRDSKEALYLKYEMPGLSKEDVNVTLKNETLFINGAVYDDLLEATRHCSARLKLSSSVFKLDSIKSNMENGVFYVVIPKAD